MLFTYLAINKESTVYRICDDHPIKETYSLLLPLMVRNLKATIALSVQLKIHWIVLDHAWGLGMFYDIFAARFAKADCNKVVVKTVISRNASRQIAISIASFQVTLKAI